MFHVLIPAPVLPVVREGLAKACRVSTLDEIEASDARSDVRGIAGGGHLVVDGAFMARFPKLEIVANFGVGYNNVDTEWARQHGIIVTNTPDVLNEEVADTALGLIIATARQLPAAERHLRAGRWNEGAFPLTATLRGRTVGILGLGRIGKAIATRAEAFGMAVVYHGRRPQPGVPYGYFPTVKALAAASDILVVIAPGGPETRHLVDADVLQALGPQGILINVARGTLVDEAALIDALAKGHILSAGLDVFEHEPAVPQALLDMDHVVLLPHVGSASTHTRNAMGQLVVDNILSWAAGRGPLTPVAETPWTQGGANA
ncbi:2-hydroxyacid dehydrogenase [Lichenihabitans sp. Uapishka_5]|uniref:2-hydroxyacid dehydrogenase n=1 Tax=Lichenihabitans sp. Uapishka_5 TaxID=3037302 RepID=UPI0029E81BD1|nr:2-hydroxyacid dehydrogenase [Lichenihabitans sp. Uapishka_5]MDX7951590.1 2-hydroxyacid dehydrogenase [Lichenihabitans sp. Uapishka_5]